MKITVTYTLKDATLGVENSDDLDTDDADAVSDAVLEQLRDMVLVDPEDFLSDIKFEDVDAAVDSVDFDEGEISFED